MFYRAGGRYPNRPREPGNAQMFPQSRPHFTCALNVLPYARIPILLTGRLPMFRRISCTWDLMKASWDVLRQDKSLLLFPLLSGLSCLVILASFAVPIWFTGFWRPPGKGSEAIHQILYYGTLFLFYFCNYFVITFFNTAVIACAIERMQGGQASVGFGFNAAAQRLPLILGWAALSATVGVILRAIEERSSWVGRIVVGLLGMAWTIVSYLAVPVMVVERAGPITSLKES